jgi:hypothetical protein
LLGERLGVSLPLLLVLRESRLYLWIRTLMLGRILGLVKVILLHLEPFAIILII